MSIFYDRRKKNIFKLLASLKNYLHIFNHIEFCMLTKKKVIRKNPKKLYEMGKKIEKKRNYGKKFVHINETIFCGHR